MEPLQFAYWLNGFAELTEGPPSADQWQAIRDHLATVFSKVTPPIKSSMVDLNRWGQQLRTECKSGPAAGNIDFIC